MSDGIFGFSPVEDELRRLLAIAAAVEEAKQAKSAGTLTRYVRDPAGFARDMIDWEAVARVSRRPAGSRPGLAAYQEEILATLLATGRLAVRGPRRMGKSMTVAVCVLWFALTRDAAGTDWKIVTTAGSWPQLRLYLWPEIHKWARFIRWDLVRGGRHLTRDELMRHQLRLAHGEASAAAPSDSAKIEGAHASALLVILDEAKIIPASTWDALEGSLAGAGTEALVLAVSTPGDPQGRFFQIHQRGKGLEDWAARHVRLEEAIAAGQVDEKWAQQRRLQYGEASQWYQTMVLGEFHAGDEDAVIPLGWILPANERWQEWDNPDPETKVPRRLEPDGPRVIGVDVATSGQDMTVIARRFGPVLADLRRFAKQDTMATAGRVKALLDADPEATAVVDYLGPGAGVHDRLAEQRCRVQAFVASHSAGNKRDAAGQLRFADKRSWAWWRMREMLDPSRGSKICLPDDELLTGDLCAPKWKVESNGRIRVESKDDIRKRLGRSTDDGDACVMAYSDEGDTFVEAYASLGVRRCWSCARPRSARAIPCQWCNAGEEAA